MTSAKEILKIAKETIQFEVSGIQQLTSVLDEEFVKSVTKLKSCSGRVVVTGMGKSAIIGQKWVATFNSTGTQAIFLHAADAIHGDIGVIDNDDIVICLSKSGDTSELKVLLPLIKSFGNEVIGVVANRDSFLAKQCDYLLYTPVDREADPNNLAPTTSTTVQIVLGDALAMTLLRLKGFSPRDFALFHPGGSLGKQLYMKVNDLSKMNEKPKVHSDQSIKETIIEISSKRLGVAAVLSEDHQITGIITDGDIRRMLLSGADINTLQAHNIMSENPKTINQDTLAIEALDLMRKHSITQLIVVDEQRKYQGIIHIHDLLKEGFI